MKIGILCVYANAFDLGSFLMDICDSNGLDECIFVWFHRFELVSGFSLAAFTALLDQGGQANFAEVFQQ